MNRVRARLQLEFSPHARRISTRSLALLLGGVLLFIVAALLAGQALTENARQSRYLAARETNRQTLAAAAPEHPDPAQLAREQFMRKTSRSLTTPWAELLATLEQAPANVALLSVEPSVAKHSLALTAEAATQQDMFNYLRALQRDNRLARALLTSHQIQVQAPGAPLRFQIQASWGDMP